MANTDTSHLKITDDIAAPPIRYTKSTSEIAQKALTGQIIPFPGYGTVKFDENMWSYQKKGLVASFQLYLHNLRIVAELCNEAKATNDIRYAQMANEIAESWVSFIKRGHTTDMTWVDHAVSLRARVFIYLLATNRAFGIKTNTETYRTLIEEHANILFDDEDHRMHNHGIMMDQALITCGLALQNERFIIKGIGRATMIFWRTFSHLGVHQENSPEYHNMVARMFRELEDYLRANGRSLGQDIAAVFEDIDRYPAKIALPSKYTPPMGDSGRKKVSTNVIWGAFHDQLSGLSVSKHEESSVYLAYVCGYSQPGHKHFDDLSILLSRGTRDYLIDSGKYNYGNNKYRHYVRSPRAHSSFSLGRKYTLEPANRIKRLAFTDHFFDTRNYTFISGYNALYETAFLRRSIFFLKNCDTLIVNDRGVTTNDDETFIQTFNFAPDLKVKNIDQVSATAYPPTPAHPALTIRNHSGIPGHVRVGDPSAKRPDAVVSLRAHHVKPTHQLVFKETDVKEVDSWISITFGGFEQSVVSFNAEKMQVLVGEHSFDLPSIDFFPSAMYCNSAEAIRSNFEAQANT